MPAASITARMSSIVAQTRSWQPVGHADAAPCGSRWRCRRCRRTSAGTVSSDLDSTGRSACTVLLPAQRSAHAATGSASMTCSTRSTWHAPPTRDRSRRRPTPTAHALVRETLHDELTASRRAGQHRKVAEALEARRRQSDDRRADGSATRRTYGDVDRRRTRRPRRPHPHGHDTRRCAPTRPAARAWR